MAAAIRHRQAGFTLLEMMVVLVLVGLISAMLMQGFVYVAGIYGSVERRQQQWQQQMLQRAWLKESVRSLTNGVDGALAQSYFFQGDEQGFSGLALQGLSYAGGVGRPLRVQWLLERDAEQGVLYLRYRELKLGQEQTGPDENPWYEVGRWPQGQGQFSYYSQGSWAGRFSGRAINESDVSPRMPELVRLQVETGARSLDIWLATAVTALPYESPERANEY